jgi:hypothetical protein
MVKALAVVSGIAGDDSFVFGELIGKQMPIV